MPEPCSVEFHTDPSRRCEFYHEDRTPGYLGVAYAIVLRALEDGVCENWLAQILRFYEMRPRDLVLERQIGRRLQKRLRVDHQNQNFKRIPAPKIMLSWSDTVPISERQLEMVA